MWYFAWILGLGLAVGVAVMNGIWLEFHTDPATDLTVED
ncbi:cytochrome bd-I oxidase subunit CydX [Stakelama sp. CBK3Z-3]|uniref:Cytochrome bd-I oxidase subunit CydX n=1 Tax=Stakelama flava TaxID=2860338 RepID=A0ABS6XMX1_9SPHN|nr:cytochrome bd-I oxidase subunit CydX [Stakelama flava]MBW4331563.1 cytochrome bd-I oxidase subunit CydX [Stakelama flava]